MRFCCKQNDDITESMGKLIIDESRSSSFKNKPVIIFLVGMEGMYFTMNHLQYFLLLKRYVNDNWNLV